MEEFTPLSRGVSFIDESTPLRAAPGAIQWHCTKVQQTKRKVPNAVNAETHQVEPANNLTFSRGGSLNVYIFSRMSRTDPIFLPPIVVDDSDDDAIMAVGSAASSPGFSPEFCELSPEQRAGLAEMSEELPPELFDIFA